MYGRCNVVAMKTTIIIATTTITAVMLVAVAEFIK